MSTPLLGVGTAKALFLYDRPADGHSWDEPRVTLSGWEVSALLMQGDRIVAGTVHYAYGPTFQISDDAGKTWRPGKAPPRFAADSTAKAKRIWQVVASPHDPSILYCGLDEASIFKSTDAGETWTELVGLSNHPSRPHWNPGAGGLCLHTILVDPTNPDRITVGISAVGVFVTEDGGATWHARNKGLTNLNATGSPDEDACYCIHKIVRSPTSPDTLFMQYHGGVFRSDDAAQSWHAIENGLPGNFGFPMAVLGDGTLFCLPLEDQEQRVFGAGKMAVYTSTDGGAKWTPTRAGLPSEPYYAGVLRDALCSGPKRDVYFVTTAGDVFATKDAGANWSKLPGRLSRGLVIRVA